MKLSAEEHGAIIKKRLEEGASYRQLARELGYNKDTINNFVRRHFPEHIRKPSDVSASLMQVLIIDIETCPNLGYVWRLWDQNISLDQLVSSTEMLSFAAKWLGDPIVFFKSVHHNGKEDMISMAWKLLDKADVVMHYNGRRFDVPHLNREFIENGHLPPSPFKQLDLLSTVKQRFRFPSNKLAYVSKALGLEGKVEHEGFKLWLKCMDGDDAAWDRMYEYNVQDVLLLENLYHALLPWIERHPSYGAVTGENVCPNCGSDDLVERGFTYTKTGKYVQYECMGCHKHVRDTRRCDKTEITEVVNS